MKHSEAITTAIELAGFALITAGVALFSIPAAFIVGGGSLVLVGWLIGRNR